MVTPFCWSLKSYGFEVTKDGCEVAEESVGELMVCQDRFFTDLISTRGLGVRGWPSGKTEILRSIVVLPE